MEIIEEKLPDDEGKAVSPPTIEFRLPDGSAHPHLLLAGIAQGMLHGRKLEDVDGVLKQTEYGSDSAKLASVPKNMKQVASALEKNRMILEDGAVFPPYVITKMIEMLKD